MFLNLKRALAPYAAEAERDVELAIRGFSDLVPGIVKVYAITVWGAALGNLALVFLCLVFPAAIALTIGKGVLPALWYIVSLIASVMVYNLVLLKRWDEEGWHICPNCDQPVRRRNFCACCGIAQK